MGHNLSPGTGTTAKAPEQGRGSVPVFIALSHSCYPGPGNLIISKLALSAGSDTLMFSMCACVCVCVY